MEFHTRVTLPADLSPIEHDGRILLMGSCFAEHMGHRLADYKFPVDTNPFGILYNPLSAAAALSRILNGKPYGPNELYFHQEQWHSPMHHGSFSSPEIEIALTRMNQRLKEAHERIPAYKRVMLTFGTACVYTDKRNGEVVSNCHKLPENRFDRRLIAVEEIVQTYLPLLKELWERNPDVKLLFTVSPVRHLRDGLHANQLSKSTLLLAVDRLQNLFPDRVGYFPAYEIVIDELRDYRFYADDMTHPSPMAVQYVWECFSRTFFTPETLKITAAVDEIVQGLAHRPVRPESEAYQRFLRQIMLKIERLNGKYPNLDFQKETALCRTRLIP